MAENCNCGDHNKRPKPPVNVPARGTYLIVDGIVRRGSAYPIDAPTDAPWTWKFIEKAVWRGTTDV